MIKPPSKEEKNIFSMMIEERAINHSVSHLEAIVDYCAETGLEEETVALLINSSLKGKLESEARDLRFLEKSSKLPI